MEIHCKHDELKHPRDLKPHPKNRNKHEHDQIKRLAKLYEYHGIRHPIIVSKRTGFIVAGHGRREAAIKAGIHEFPVVYQDFESEEKEYAFIQADNAIALWADLDLSAINVDLGDLGPDFDIDMLGIENFTLEPAEKHGAIDDDEVPEVTEPITKPGDLWILGNHRLLCGDSTSIDAVEKLMGGEKAELCFTSPPYNAGDLDFRRGISGKKYLHDQDLKDNFDQFLSSALSNTLTVSRVVGFNIQLLSKNIKSVHKFLYRHVDELVDSSVWTKSNPPPSTNDGVMSHAFEMIYWFSSDIKNRKIGDFKKGEITNHFHSSVGNDNIPGVHHATFSQDFVNHWLGVRSGPVLDPFGGSGSTLIACEKTNRKCFMMEIDPHYCDVIKGRWEKFTGQKAELANAPA